MHLSVARQFILKMHLPEARLSEKSFVPTKVGIEMDSERIPRGLATGLASE